MKNEILFNLTYNIRGILSSRVKFELKKIFKYIFNYFVIKNWIR
jgi:hypothetical protein